MSCTVSPVTCSYECTCPVLCVLCPQSPAPMSVHVLYCVYWLCRFSPDDQLLAVGSADGHVTIYQTSPAQGVGTRYRQFKAANNAGITHVDWSQSGKYIQVGFIIGISGHPFSS